MLNSLAASPGLLFFSFLYRSDLFQEKTLKNEFEKIYGQGFLYHPLTNPLAAYYSSEMGEESLLKRFFLLSEKIFPREYLVSSKLLAMEWEKKWSIDERRMVNVDVGMLSAENFLLATTKNYSHRVYLSHQIFADLTYYFHQGQMTPLPWTYPDYLDDKKREFLNWGRNYLLLYQRRHNS
jgi:hypothetical protein